MTAPDLPRAREHPIPRPASTPPPGPASTPSPPYIAVTFTSLLTADTDGYEETADRLLELARQQDGFLGFESAREADGLGISVSYWRDEAAVTAWRDEVEHAQARHRGVRQWYERYEVRVAVVHRSQSFSRAVVPPDRGEPDNPRAASGEVTT